MTEPWSLINRKFPTNRTCRTEEWKKAVKTRHGFYNLNTDERLV